MKLDCKIIEDLIPLYIDGVCSLVQPAQTDHIANIVPNENPPEKAVKKAFKKIRLRWIVSVLAAVALIPVLILGYNQYRGRGAAYTNIKELYIGSRFIISVEEGNYEKAFDYINISGIKQEWAEEWFDDAILADIKTDGKNKFCEYGDKLEQSGGISGCKYVGISLCGERRGEPIYRLVYSVRYADKDVLFDIIVSDDGVEYFGGGGSFVTDPLAQFSIWSEYLWQEYAGCFFDPDTGTYVYYE